MTIYDLIIIGGGPAGITAGIYATRQTLKTLLITKEFGGQMAKKAVDIENWPGETSISGQQLVEKFVNHLKAQKGIEIKFQKVEKITKESNDFVVFTNEDKFRSLAVIIATGADPIKLNVSGEKEFLGKGVSYCATCDGPLFKDKKIAVIGGGNAGLETAIFMTNYAEKIYILEFNNVLKADQFNQNEVKRIKKIEIILNAKTEEIKGDKFVNSLIYRDLFTNELKTLAVDGVFIEIGAKPATDMVEGLVDFNEKKERIVEFETFQTKTPGLFAVGDANIGKYKQIVAAAGEGCKAALAAYEYIKSLKNKNFV
jgi:thioredoxin-disulfide reductase